MIHIGSLPMGGDYPIVIQSMTTTDTMDIEKTVAQAKELADVGCDLVRITAPTVPDAEALKTIRDRLHQDGYKIPLVADIHFVPAAAMVAADYVEKVRINPGNYADRKLFKIREYSDREYQEELERIHDKFKPLVLKLKSLDRALRIGTNHGSLSDRIMNRYGDTPEGMVESAFEFAEICRAYEFHNFCFSMKASNTGVMVQAYRLLVAKQLERGWDYPIHLGVTEAGDGEDGRMKSAIGIGTVLAEGIGDTIRVSLTESPAKEVPVARALAKKFPRTRTAEPGHYSINPSYKAFGRPPQVWWTFRGLDALRRDFSHTKLRPDVLYIESLEDHLNEFHFLRLQLQTIFQNSAMPQVAVPYAEDWWNHERSRKKVLDVAEIIVAENRDAFLALNALPEDKVLVQFATCTGELKTISNLDPSKTVIRWKAEGEGLDFILNASLDVGSAFVDFAFRGILIEGRSAEEALSTSFGLLQGTRRRMSKTEYISCPSCGRTLFDLEETTARIKAVTSHLKTVKIAVMGCIVNGPGEMADADFGYVGGAPGRVNLYVGKDCVEKNIPSEEAPLRLVGLIKQHGRWADPT